MSISDNIEVLDTQTHMHTYLHIYVYVCKYTYTYTVYIVYILELTWRSIVVFVLPCSCLQFFKPQRHPYPNPVGLGYSPVLSWGNECGGISIWNSQITRWSKSKGRGDWKRGSCWERASRFRVGRARGIQIAAMRQWKLGHKMDPNGWRWVRVSNCIHFFFRDR